MTLFLGLGDRGAWYTEREIAQRVGMTRGQVTAILKRTRRLLLGPEADVTRRADQAGRRRRITGERLRALPPDAFDVLHEWERLAMVRKYGLLGKPRQSQAEIGKRLDLGRHQLGQVIKRAVASLIGD